MKMLNDLDDGEVMFFINPSNFAFLKFDGIDYDPKIKTLIRIMDTPEEDVIHYYIVQAMPAIIKLH